MTRNHELFKKGVSVYMINSGLMKQWFRGCPFIEQRNSIKFYNPYLKCTTLIWYNQNNTYGFEIINHSGNYRAEDERYDGLNFFYIKERFDNPSSVNVTQKDIINMIQELKRRFG